MDLKYKSNKRNNNIKNNLDTQKVEDKIKFADANPSRKFKRTLFVNITKHDKTQYKATIDRTAKAAYLYINKPTNIQLNIVDKTLSFLTINNTNIDIDKDNNIIGIEYLFRNDKELNQFVDEIKQIASIEDITDNDNIELLEQEEEIIK